MTTEIAHRFWLIFCCSVFGIGGTAELYGLIFNWRWTLSAWVWSFEKFQPGQPITHWTALHFLFILALLSTDLWLLGHFAFGWWR